MSQELVPKLEEIVVEPEKLFLDPNNPRLIAKREDQRDENAAVTLAAETQKRMEEDSYRVGELKESIKENGWIPVDYIFVRRLVEETEPRYLVLEGNRRVTAIKGLLADEDLDPDVRSELQTISVMEIIDELPEEELRKKITYLLGVRHHGALKKWTPFAQAQNIYLRYAEHQNSDTFIWDQEVASHVANALSIDVTKSNGVRDRLQVYVAMQQLAEHPVVVAAVEADPKAGIKDRYYSVVSEVVNNSKGYQGYINTDPETFLLDSESANRMIGLCNFDHPNRKDAPISNPQEWRKLLQILKDEDTEKRAGNLERVEVQKEKPSDVWAERATELSQLQWDSWLESVNAVLRQVTIDDSDAGGSAEVMGRLNTLLQSLRTVSDER